MDLTSLSNAELAERARRLGDGYGLGGAHALPEALHAAAHILNPRESAFADIESLKLKNPRHVAAILQSELDGMRESIHPGRDIVAETIARLAQTSL